MDQESHQFRAGTGTVTVLTIALLMVVVRGASGVELLSDEGTAPVLVVDRDDLLAAMAEEMLEGYDPTATTNAGRFFAQVILSLARDAHTLDSDGPPLLIRHQDWFYSFLEINDLTGQTAPIGSKLAFEYQQDVLIDYRGHLIVKNSKNGVYPLFALNVQISWSKSADLPDHFSFEDTTSTPRLRMTSQRVIRFRLLEFSDMIVYDKLEGITGRPVSGVLGALFKVIGDGRLVWTKMTVTESGIQVTHARAKKGFFSVTETITIYPDGIVEKGLPDDSPEMKALEDRLKQKIEIDYGDWAMPESDPN